MIPQLLVKCKEVMMDIQSNLLELEEAAQRISDGLAAIQVMILGMDGMDSQYTGALYAIWEYLSSAEQAFQICLNTCLEQV